MNGVDVVNPMSSRTRFKYATHGKLIELLKMTPQSKWRELDDRGDSFLSYTFYSSSDNIDAIILLGLSRLFDFKTFSSARDTMSPFMYSIRYCDVKYTTVLCAMGYTYTNENPIEFSRNHTTSRFLISNGWRLNFHSTSLNTFQRRVVKCRDTIVVLLGLKKRRVILPKLDRFLVQEEMAVAIWATRARIDENE